MRDIEHLFNDIDDYYNAILAKESFKGNYRYYEITGDKDKKLSLKQYLYTITPNLVELINEKKNSTRSEQKVQLTLAVNFRHTTDNNTRTFCVKSDNVEILPASDTNDVVIKLFESFLNKYEQEENILRNGSNYLFGSVEGLGIHFHNIKLNRGSSYIPSPKWVFDKKATINPKNLNDDKCFPYAIIAALHHNEISNNPERITKLKPLINNYNRNGRVYCRLKR